MMALLRSCSQNTYTLQWLKMKCPPSYVQMNIYMLHVPLYPKANRITPTTNNYSKKNKKFLQPQIRQKHFFLLQIYDQYSVLCVFLASVPVALNSKFNF